MNEDAFTREEVGRVADKAFWEGVGQGGIDYVGGELECLGVRRPGGIRMTLRKPAKAARNVGLRPDAHEVLKRRVALLKADDYSEAIILANLKVTGSYGPWMGKEDQ